MSQRSHRWLLWSALALAVLAVPAVARAQSGFSGVVKDASGGVMPGVTVEAASPALIEKVRTVVTDEQGQYKILDLRPGVYSVTFTLEGFATTKRENIELPVNMTAQVNGEMRVGALTEMVTVTGQAAVVDVQSAVSQQVLPQRLLDAIPTGGRNIQSVGATLVGINPSAPDVGGTAGMQQTYLTSHGSDTRDNAVMVDGIRLNGIESDGAIQQYFNQGMFAEMAYQTGGVQADTSAGGVRLNMIPKDGGNVVKGDVFFSANNHNLQAAPALLVGPTGSVVVPNGLDSMYDLNIGVGGPLMKDKLWFFSSVRSWGVNNLVTNSFYPLVDGLNTFTPDQSKQVVDDNNIKSFMTRLTYQLSSKNKLAGYLDKIIKFRGHESAGSAGASAAVRSENMFGIRHPKQYYTTVVKWTGTWTNRLLFEAGWGMNNESYNSFDWQPGLAEAGAIPKVDLTTGAIWGAPSSPYVMKRPIRTTEMVNLSYVTGSHALKVGLEHSHGIYTLQQSFPNPNVNFSERFRNGVPDSVYIWNTPTDQRDRLNHDLGIYIADTYTLKRVTLTPGLRFEYLEGSHDEEGIPVSAQALLLKEGYPERPLFPAHPSLPKWTDWAPRMGVAWDVFGDGRTAVKASASKYMVAYSTGFAATYNPMVLSTEVRTWTDSNKNLIYDPGVDVLSPSTSKTFGLNQRPNVDPNIRRPYNVEYTATVQQQVAKGVSATVGYFRRAYSNILYMDNPVIEAFGPGAFSPITINNPCATNASWNCGGVQPSTITVWNINPALQGLGWIEDHNSKTNTRVFNGIEAQFMARVAKVTVFGGTSISRQITNNCDVAPSNSLQAASNPNEDIGCDQNQYPIPWRAQFKLNGVYELPYQLSMSGTLQSYPGASTGVNLSASRSNVPGLVNSQTIPLIDPQSKFLARWNQVDVRFSRKFVVGRSNFQIQMDIFNALNFHPVTAATTTASPSLNTPTAILQSRMFSFGGQWHF